MQYALGALIDKKYNGENKQNIPKRIGDSNNQFGYIILPCKYGANHKIPAYSQDAERCNQRIQSDAYAETLWSWLSRHEEQTDKGEAIEKGKAEVGKRRYRI